ncbi:MAG TPA: hypothetical protein VF529_22750 [Solirubrobacteraceae bacterium]|jgi:hypothetical protein
MRGQAGASAPLKQVLYTLAGAAGGALAGLLFAGAGVLAGADARVGVTLAAVVPLVGLGLWEASGRRARLAQRDEETPQRWLHLGPVRWAVANGASLGFALTTRLGFPLWYVIPVLAFAAGNLWFGPALWATYGIVRTSLAWWILAYMRNRRPDSVLDGLIRLQPRLRRLTAMLLTVDGSALVVLAVVA